MSDTSTKDFYTRQAAEARGPEPPRPPRRKQRGRRIKRIAIASGASLAVLAGLVVGGTFLAANQSRIGTELGGHLFSPWAGVP